jgi:CDP-diacylglycerol--serine O-phosphatidyltransferase
VLLYKWMLADLGFIGVVIGFVYVACGALRLARFNVLASRELGSSKYFVGLPIPLAAGAVVSLVMSSYPFDQPFLTPISVAVIATLLAALMVSNVRYRTFKDLRPSKKSITIGFVLAVVLGGLSTQLKPTIALAAFFLGYISLGLAEGLIFFKARRAEAETAIPDEEQEPTEADEEFADDEDEDEDVQEQTT